MHHFMKKNFAVLLVGLIGLNVISHAAPAEKVRTTLTRTAASALQLSSSLTKNIFRQDSVQVPYTVQEPYQETETYTVQVPYQDTETYYEDVPYQVEETYTDYESYTDYEYRCRDVRRDERVCHDEESCHIAPGRGPGGGPNRICTTQPVCKTVPRHSRECSNVPVTKTRPVTKRRVVTRYRQEQRVRTVTRYRDELRTRTVTKYRDKQVCCKTEIRTVFDHQFTLPVLVNFPVDTALVGQEQEIFDLQFAGSEASPSATLTPKAAIFGYIIDRQELRGGALVMDLKRVALYNQDQLGVSSIQGLALQATKTGALIRFSDQGLRPRVATAYSYQVQEVGSPDILAQGSLTPKNAQVEIPLQVLLVENKTYRVDIRVVRKGLPLDSDIDVVASATQKVTSLKDASVYLNQALVNTFEIRGEKEEARLFFRDQTPTDEGVRTTYHIEVVAGSKSSSQILSSKVIARESMIVTTKNFFRMLLGPDLGVSAQALNEKVREGKSVSVRIKVTREHLGLNEGAPVVFTLAHTEVIQRE